jgi:hypothetical protein
MWGLEFREDSLICGTAEFEVRKRTKDGRDESTLYRLAFGPHGTWIDQMDIKGKWVRINDNASTEDIEALLPKRSDFGFDWTHGDFILALTFYGEGFKRGDSHGRYKEQERARIRATRQPAPTPAA